MLVLPAWCEDASVPRFHFHINGEQDVEGFELADVRVAQCEALAMAGRIICDADADVFWEGGDWSMKVTTPDGLALFDLTIVGNESPAIKKASRL